jgi:two-component system, NarL family, sensor histidine kinase UhpB
MDLRMRLVCRVAALSLGLLLMFGGVVAWSLSEDVADEVEASSHLAELVMAANSAARGDAVQAVATVENLIRQGALRHVRASMEAVAVEGAPGLPPADDEHARVRGGEGVVAWLAAHLPVPDTAQQVHRVSMGAAVLQLRPDPRSEVQEIVRDAARTLVALLVFCLATVAATWVAAHRALAPVRELESGLARIARGEPASRMPHFELREFDRIARAIDGLSASLDRAHAAQQRLTRQLLEVQESERRELARELHDEIGQSLTAIGVNAAFIDKHADRAGPGPLRECAGDIRAQAQRISLQVRGMLNRLRPYGLEQVGMVAALSDLIDGVRQRGKGLDIAAHLPADLPAMTADQGLTLYRTLQEALTNVQRHTEAIRVEVQVHVDEGRTLRLSVTDNGGGQADEVRDRMGGGLLGMQERAVLSGSTLVLSQGPRGLCIELALQLQRQEHE